MKIVLFANTDWYLYNFRLPLAQALRTAGHEVVLVSPPGAFVQQLQAAGFPWIGCPLDRRSTNPLGESRVVGRLVRIYRQVKPDLVHHFTLKSVVYGSWAARLARVPHVVNAVTGLGHVFANDDGRAGWLQPILRLLCKTALHRTAVIFQNPDDQRAFLDLGVADPADTHVILGSGVDMAQFDYHPEPEGEPLVILASRMLREKGIQEFVEAARLLRSQGRAARFVLIGNTDPDNLAAIPRAQLEAWNEEGAVAWWGFRSDMPEIVSQSHIVCLPSWYREGVPKILIEAASCGRPIVTTDMPGCREIVEEGVNGYLIPPRDAEALSRALGRLLDDASLRRSMGQRGRQRVRERFSLEQVIRETFDVYRGLAPDRFTRPAGAGARSDHD